MLGRALVEAMTFNAIRYRTYFEDARKRAEQVADPFEKQAWLRSNSSFWLWRNNELRLKRRNVAPLRPPSLALLSCSLTAIRI